MKQLERSVPIKIDESQPKKNKIEQKNVNIPEVPKEFSLFTKQKPIANRNLNNTTAIAAHKVETPIDLKYLLKKNEKISESATSIKSTTSSELADEIDNFLKEVYIPDDFEASTIKTANELIHETKLDSIAYYSKELDKAETELKEALDNKLHVPKDSLIYDFWSLKETSSRDTVAILSDIIQDLQQEND